MSGTSRWLRRTLELHRELAEIAEIAELDPRWWLLAGSVALAETRTRPHAYLACGVEPDADTFMGQRSPPPSDLVADALVRARAARTALRELHGILPDQPLAVTLDHTWPGGIRPSRLDVVAFAIGARCVTGSLDDPGLAAVLTAVLQGVAPPRWSGAPPFVCVSIGDEPLSTARHGHRRAWAERGGPWLGLGRSGELAVTSTCHFVLDGYGHARVAARIAELVAEARTSRDAPFAPAPPLAIPAGAVPLSVTWRELDSPTTRVIPLAYELGMYLHARAGRPNARFSPTIQIPVARGRRDDPLRLRHRIVSATTSVRFAAGVPEPFDVFDARVRGVFAREAQARGLISRLLAAARAVPLPDAWKRKGVSATRPRWLENLADVIGGRALLSRIVVDVPLAPTCAVSSPARLATARDPFGSCVITVVDDGRRGAITVCGSGLVGAPHDAGKLLDQLVAAASARHRVA
ncbi:MAG: hypothetical protein SFX73_33140 [Kofleriaceae bacterium]|nr:hypothetical protein [Kofleriaceae bacterium]